jgi:hypothetical protein
MRNQPAMQGMTAESYNEIRKEISAAMKMKRLLQILIVLTLLFSLIGTHQPVSANTAPQFRGVLQLGSSISIAVQPTLISRNETATATVSLKGVPSSGYTSAEFNCTYRADLVQVSDIVVSGLFGPDPATVISSPQDGIFIVAIAGSQGNKATAGGPVFTFRTKGLDTGQAVVSCTARVSDGTNILTGIGTATTGLAVMEATATPTIAPTACDKAEFIADINVSPGTVMSAGTPFTKTWRFKNVGSCTWTNSYRIAFFSGEQMGAVSSAQFPISVAPGQMVDLSLNMTAPSAPGSYRGYWIFQNINGAPFGVGPQGNGTWFVDILVSDGTVTPAPSLTPSISPTPTVSATATAPSDRLRYVNPKYGFEFYYPSDGHYAGNGTDNHVRIILPFTPGTILYEKYLDVTIVENSELCRSPLATTSTLDTVGMAFVNGIIYLQESGHDRTPELINRWFAFSTYRDNVCVSLDLVLRATNPDAMSTPPPFFDEVAEYAVLQQVVGTYAWLPLPTSTPGEQPISTATQTSTPFEAPTLTLTPTGTTGIITGQVLAGKPVTLDLFDTGNRLITSILANADGTFALTAPSGTYNIVADAHGFLSAKGSVTVTGGSTSTMPAITLLAGDIDGDFTVNQFDALTIGMNYNTSFPVSADLNNDGIINVLDLELVAKNYRKIGPVSW